MADISPDWFEGCLERLWPQAATDALVVLDGPQGCEFSGQSAFTYLSAPSFTEKQYQLTAATFEPTKLALYGHFIGCHSRPFAGIPPTSRRVSLEVSLICEIDHLKIQRIRLEYDVGFLLEQLGLVG